MSTTNTATNGGPAPRTNIDTRWRTVDIVVAAVLGVAMGVVFWGWNKLWAATEPAFAFFTPSQAVIYGIWLMAGILGALIVRRPGAAVFTELVASVVSALVGSQWGLQVVWYGLLQGLAAEVVFLAFLYKVWRLPVAALAGAAAGLAAALLDVHYYYADYSAGWKLAQVGITAASAALIAGLGSWLLVRALAPTGVLAPFAAGRERERV